MDPSGRARNAPDGGLAGGEHGLQLGRQGQAAIAIERNSLETAFQEILIGVHLPSGRGCGAQRQRPSADSSAMVRSALIRLLPPALFSIHSLRRRRSRICNSSILEPRGTHTPCAACALARIRPTDGGGFGQVLALNLEGRVGSPYPHVGVGVGPEIIQERDQLRGAFGRFRGNLLIIERVRHASRRRR